MRALTYATVASCLVILGLSAKSHGAAAVAASRETCTALKEELGKMQKAQAALMKSLVQNHELYAVQLEESEDLVGKARKSYILRGSEAIRKRGLEAQKLQTKFMSESQELLEKVSSCL